MSARSAPPVSASTQPQSGPSNPFARGHNQPVTGRLPTPTPSPVPNASIRPPPSSVPPAGTLNSTASAPQDTQAQTVAENALLRIPYGRVSMGAQVVDVMTYAGLLIVIVAWGEAGAGGIDAIETVYLDDKPVPSGVVVTNYLGTQVVPDPTLLLAYPGYGITYTDAFTGVAYSVLQIPTGVTSGFPKVSAVLRGLKVYDPRDGTQTLGVPSSYKYSDNAALCMADLEVNAVYGAGGSVDWTTVTTAANANDALVGGIEKRRTIGLVIDNSQDIEAWRETMRAYAGCFVDRSSGTMKLIPDRPASSTFTFNETPGATVNCRVKNVKRRSKRNVPTVVSIRYTDTTAYPWRDRMAFAYAAGVLGGSVPWKMSDVALPGITRSTQALREAIERLNKLTINDITLDIDGQDESLAVTMGDVVTASANVGLTSRLVRVVRPQIASAGRPSFSCEAYDPAVYSDSVTSAPSIVDTTLPNPSQLDPPTSLVILEHTYLEQANGSTLAAGLIYQERFDCSWTAPASSFPVDYRVEVWDTTTRVRNDFVAGTTYSTPALQQGKTYTIKVFSRNTLTESSAALTGSQFANGKSTPPGPVPSITRSTSLGGKVIFNWLAAFDVDVVRYEWRYTPNVTGGGTWAGATFIDRIDGLGTVFQGLPTGTHRFYVRAVDSVGQYSASDCTVDLLVDSDPNALISSKTFSSPTLTNMASIPMLEGIWLPRWITDAGDVWSTGSSPVNTGTDPIGAEHSNATQTWRSESWDLGSLVSGAFSLTAFITALSGAVNSYIETSPDNSVYTRQPGFSWQGAARFLKVTFEALTSATLQVDAPPKLSLAALTRHEQFVVPTSATLPVLVALAGQYVTKQNLQLTPLEATAARIPTVARLLLNSQSGLMMTWVQSGISGANDGFEIQNIFGSSRVILAGDFFEYDVWIDSSSPAATNTSAGAGLNLGIVTLHDATASSYPALVDTVTGNNIRSGAGLDNRGAWYSRRIDLTAFVGHTVDQVNIGSDSDSNGTYTILYRNMRFTNGAGTDRLAVWPPTLGGSIQTEPSANSTTFTAFSSGLKCGPANTMQVYCFTDAGAQVAQSVQVAFDGY